MILGASLNDIVAFLVVLAIAILLGLLYIVLFFVRTVTKSQIVRFIYDFLYAIIVGGIFILTMLRVNMCDVKYYHILALIIGIILAGVLPVSHLKRYESGIIDWSNRVRTRVRASKVYQIIKK